MCFNSAKLLTFHFKSYHSLNNFNLLSLIFLQFSNSVDPKLLIASIATVKFRSRTWSYTCGH